MIEKMENQGLSEEVIVKLRPEGRDKRSRQREHKA